MSDGEGRLRPLTADEQEQQDKFILDTVDRLKEHDPAQHAIVLAQYDMNRLLRQELTDLRAAIDHAAKVVPAAVDRLVASSDNNTKTMADLTGRYVKLQGWVVGLTVAVAFAALLQAYAALRPSAPPQVLVQPAPVVVKPVPVSLTVTPVGETGRKPASKAKR
jgi:hypothetical protein